MNLEGHFCFGTIFDLLLRTFLPLPAPEVATALGLCLALFFALLLGESKSWRFALIVSGVFLYLGAFQASYLPCLVVSAEYAGTPLSSVLRRLQY